MVGTVPEFWALSRWLGQPRKFGPRPEERNNYQSFNVQHTVSGLMTSRYKFYKYYKNVSNPRKEVLIIYGGIVMAFMRIFKLDH